jgi:hypothetical protein
VTPSGGGPRADASDAPADPGAPETSAAPADPGAPAAAGDPAGTLAADARAGTGEEPCGALQAAIEERRAFLARAAAERDRFGYVQDDADASALRLLESLRRCEEHPGDPDCQAPAVERDVSEMGAPVERDPSDLDATDEPGAITHDPVLLALERELSSCERARVAQPLLSP